MDQSSITGPEVENNKSENRNINSTYQQKQSDIPEENIKDVEI